MDYIAILHKDPTSDYGVSFPDFPGCITAGSTLEEAKNMAIEALSFHIEGMLEDKETIPAPSTLDTIMDSPDFKDGVAFLVSTAVPDKTVRVNITLTERELSQIDAAAKQAGASRSAFLVNTALHNI